MHCRLIENRQFPRCKVANRTMEVHREAFKLEMATSIRPLDVHLFTLLLLTINRVSQWTVRLKLEAIVLDAWHRLRYTGIMANYVKRKAETICSAVCHTHRRIFLALLWQCCIWPTLVTKWFQLIFPQN